MKKIISIILLCSLLLVCFFGCSISDLDDVNGTTSGEDGTTTGEDGTTSNNEINSTPEDNVNVAELNDLFSKLRKDSNDSEKIQFSVIYEDLHYELKKSDKYDDEDWIAPTIIVTVSCNYDLATNENWYKECSNADVKTLNTAFFNEYRDELSEGHFTPWSIAPALYFEYVHSENTLSETLNEFYSDYDILKQLMDLVYVNDISIGYYYSVPGSYFDD